MEISRLTRDGTDETVSRNQISGANGDRKMIIFPVQLTTSRIGNLTRLIHALAILVPGKCDDHTTDEQHYECISRVRVSPSRLL